MPGFETTETIDNADLRHLAEQVAFDAQVSIDRGQYDITPEDDDTGPSAEQEEPTADTAPASILSETVEMAATDEEAAEPAPPADPGGTVPPGNVPPTPPGGSDEAEPNEPYEKDGDKPAAVSPTIIIDAKKTENFGEDLSELLSQAGGNTGDRSAYEVHRINPGDTDMSFEALLRKYVDSVGTGAIGANEYEYTSVDEDPAEREALNHLFAPDIKGDSTPVADGNESADAPADDEPAFEIFPIAQGDRDLPFDELVNKYIDPEAAPNYATDDSPAPGAVKPVFAVYFEEGPVGSDAETLDASQLTAQVAAEGLLAEWGVAEGDIPLLDEQTEQADAGEPQESRPADTIESTTEPTAIAPDQQAGLYQIGQDASSSPAASTAEATPNAPASPEPDSFDDWTTIEGVEGVTRASGASEPGIDGIHDARALQENESVWLIAEYFETSPAEAQAVLDELQVKGTEAMGAWSIREGFTPSMGDRVTEAFDNKARNRNRNNRNDTEQQD